MKPSKSKGLALYKPGEFARMAGVTVRALHHYDRVGLLKPRDHGSAGCRLYREQDLERLQQIVTLKFIGFSLREIKGLLQGADLGSALHLQRQALEARRRQMDGAIRAIAQVERLLGAKRSVSSAAFQKIISEIHMQTNTDMLKQYYNDEAQKLIAERQVAWTPELQKKSEEDWASLIKDIEAAAKAGIDPASPEGQALADRHTRLIEGFTGGHAVIREGLDKLWADQANWSDAMKHQILGPMAKHGVSSVQGNPPSLFSDAGSVFIQQALDAAKARK